MKNSTIETWVWVLIYGGLLAVGLGLAMQQQGAAFFALGDDDTFWNVTRLREVPLPLPLPPRLASGFHSRARSSAPEVLAWYPADGCSSVEVS